MHQDRTWRKSSYSTGTPESDCVEVSFASDVLVRDSKNTEAGALAFGAPTWRAFVVGVRA